MTENGVRELPSQRMDIKLGAFILGDLFTRTDEIIVTFIIIEVTLFVTIYCILATSVLGSGRFE